MTMPAQALPSSVAPPARAVPVVGIGASAGGLEAICAFLSGVAPGSGLAYVVVQHLDPRHKSMLAELLRQATGLPVRELAGRTEIEADCVYVNLPNQELGFAAGALQPLAPARPPGQRLPIDAFFQALAAERGPLAAGVLLSGGGADGSEGLRAIRDGGGLTVVQEPATAGFDAMPRSAIAAGVADLVVAPAEMAARIRDYWAAAAGPLAPGRGAALQQVYALLQTQSGADFSGYKLNTVLRRIERRMKLHQCARLDDYVSLLRANPAEVELLFKELLIGVTSFFRDPKVWEQLRLHALPQLLAAHPEGLALKAWVPACSSGEEAYTLAMVFCEALDRIGLGGEDRQRYSLQIFATDLDPDAIARARQGEYGPGMVAGMPAERLQRHFVRTDKGGYRIRKELRNTIIFAQQNVISDPPFTKLDLLCCRNLLIYFTPALQEQLLPLFHYALKPGGLLVLGSADTAGRGAALFAPCNGNGGIYRRLDGAAGPVAACFPTRANGASPLPSSAVPTPSMNGNLKQQLEQLLLSKHAPASILLNRQGDILYIHGRTGAYLEPAAGKANWNIHAMARDGLRYELAELLQRAAAAGAGMVTQRGLVWQDGAAPPQALDLTAELMGEGQPLAGLLLLTIAGAPLPPARRRSRNGTPRLSELEQQLALARQEIQAVRAEMQASREELRAANEELQSTNEELQSANEELTTSKEEMQSLNEELYTVNAELQSKVDDLSLVNGDMKNLLNSTDIATIFLDSALHIRRFTDPATRIYKLIPGDLNRPLGDIVNELDYPGLERDAAEVLHSLVFCEREVPSRDGRWYTVRIMPYRTVDNVIDGVVLTFVDVTAAKLLEARLRALQGAP